MKSCALALAILVPLVPTALSASDMGGPPLSNTESAKPRPEPEAPFPALYRVDTLARSELAERSRPYWAATALESEAMEKRAGAYESLLLNNDLVAFYGSPRSRLMGILGRYPLVELDSLLDKYAASYDAINGDRGVIKAYYLIYGTVWPEGEIGYLSDEMVHRYIEFAAKQGALVFLDHQIGKYTVEASLQRLLPYLRYPNVHLALDPEWRTHKPMEEIGTVSGEEINKAQRTIQDYLIDHGLEGTRMLVIHQFNSKMISQRQSVDASFPRVRLIHCADGFGSPALKRLSYAYNARADNIPLKGFKLFLNFGIPGAGVDAPLLSPAEVLALDPRPYLIMYQ